MSGKALGCRAKGCGQKLSQAHWYHWIVRCSPGCSLAAIVGISGLNEILTCLNIAPVNESGAQRTVNKISDKLVDINQKDMAMQRQYVKDVNVLRGLPADTAQRYECDGRYNNPCYSSGGKTPSQPATQATALIIENSTPKKKIVSAATINKLCAKCGNDPDVECDDCSANIPLDAAIGNEEKWTEMAVHSMVYDAAGPSYIGYLTTDLDSTAAKGAQRAQMRPLVNLADTQHLGKAVKNAVLRAKFSTIMLGKQPVAKQEKLQRELAWDVKRRVEAEFSHAFKQHDGDLAAVKNHLSYSCDAILDCLSASCGKKCREYSGVCGGPGQKRQGMWFHRRFCVKPGEEQELTREDRQAMRKCLAVRLSPASVEKQRFNTNTQKVESVHRTFSKCNSRMQTCIRNFPGRIHSGIHMRNHGIAASTMKKCEAVGAQLTPGGTVARKLLAKEKRAQQQRKRYGQSSAYKHSQLAARIRQYQAYSRKTVKTGYAKEMQLNAVKSLRNEHAYQTRSKYCEHSYSK